MVARWLVGTVGILAAAAALGGCSKKQPTGQRAPEDKPPEVSTVVSVGFGSGAGQLGATSPEEASAEGPKSFVVDAQGRIHVLDQVNGRIQTFENGKATSSVTLPARPFEDIELDSGGFLLLDLYQTPAIVGVGPDGSTVGELPLPLEEIPEPGLVTGLSKNTSGMWLEVEGEFLVQVGDSAGTPVEPNVVPGQLVAENEVFRAVLDQPKSLSIHRQESLEAAPAPFATLDLPHLVREPSLLAKAPNGSLHVVALLEHEQSDPATPPEQEHVLVKLSASGSELGRHTLPASSGVLETYRNVRLGADGNVYVLTTSDKGVEIVKVTP